jgi:hypothetical protein
VTEIGDHCVRRLLCLDGRLAEALRYRLLRTTVRLVRGPPWSDHSKAPVGRMEPAPTPHYDQKRR